MNKIILILSFLLNFSNSSLTNERSSVLIPAKNPKDPITLPKGLNKNVLVIGEFLRHMS